MLWTSCLRQLFLLVVAISGVAHLSSPLVLASGSDSTADIEMVRRAVANYAAREPLRNDYTYLQRVVRVDFLPDQKPVKQTGVYEIIFLEGEPYRRLVSINGRAPSAEQGARDQALFEAEAKARKSGSSVQGPIQKSFAIPIGQLLDDFDLHWRGKEHVNGYETQVIGASPKEEFYAMDADQEYARHFKMKLWIDTAESQIVRLEVTVINGILMIDQQEFELSPAQEVVASRPIRIAIAPQTTYAMEWTKINDEAWLPKWTHWKAAKPTMKLSPDHKPVPLYPSELISTYSAYKKFRVKTYIAPN
jgi:hypothetical protein